MPNPRAQEMRCRKAAERQLLGLSKSRRRDPNAPDFGVWTLTSARGKVLVRGSLDDVEAYLYREPESR